MKIHASFIAFWICAAALLVLSVFYYPKWKMPATEAAISWDVSGYYYYLPAFFIYKDAQKLAFKDSIEKKYAPAGSFYQAFLYKNGNYVMKYPCGQALMYAPFFFAAHIFAKLLGYPPDGFSAPYQFTVFFGGVLVAMLGLWTLRKNLLFYFNDTTVAVVLLLLVFATNYLNYASIDNAMTHNYLFTLFSFLVALTIRFYKLTYPEGWDLLKQADFPLAAPSYWLSAGIGFLIGLAALTRPSEAIVGLIPLLWGVSNFARLKERIGFIGRHSKIYLVAAVCCFSVASLQFFYWKYAGGHWLIYSYQDQTFSWLRPHILDGMFSFRAGWLIYTPMALSALAGFIFLYWQYRFIFIPIFIYFLLQVYITWAWDIWWYGGSLGQRAMVQSYALLAFPMAAFVEKINMKQVWITAFAIFAIFCIYYNLWMTHQAHRGGLFRAGDMTKAYLFEIWGKGESQVPLEAQKLLDTNESYDAEPQNPVVIYANDFEKDTVATTSVNPIAGSKSLILDKETQWSPAYQKPLPTEGYKWIRASATFRRPDKEWDVWKMAQMIVRIQEKENIVKEKAIRVDRLLQPGETKKIWIDMKIPRKGKPYDKVSVLFWNAGSEKEIRIDDLSVSLFK